MSEPYDDEDDGGLLDAPCCPHCGSTDVHEEYEADDDVGAYMMCGDCDATWDVG